MIYRIAPMRHADDLE